jgi:hypothetical protein
MRGVQRVVSSGMLMDLALVLENNALSWTVCMTNPTWCLKTSHGNLFEGAKLRMRP